MVSTRILPANRSLTSQRERERIGEKGMFQVSKPSQVLLSIQTGAHIQFSLQNLKFHSALHARWTRPSYTRRVVVINTRTVPSLGGYTLGFSIKTPSQTCHELTIIPNAQFTFPISDLLPLRVLFILGEFSLLYHQKIQKKLFSLLIHSPLRFNLASTVSSMSSSLMSFETCGCSIRPISMLLPSLDWGQGMDQCTHTPTQRTHVLKNGE